MIYISHRGNLRGKNANLENKPDYIYAALNEGFECEIDVWYNKGWWLGHDEPKYHIDNSNLLINCWCHAKNKAALNRFKKRNDIHYFWHEDEESVRTSEGHLWVHVNRPVEDGCICVLPEQYEPSISLHRLIRCGGICSDMIDHYRGLE